MTTNRANAEKLKGKYFELTKKLSEKQLQDLLAILYSEPELVIANGHNNQLRKKHKEYYRNRWHSLSMFESQEYKALTNLLRKDFGVLEKDVKKEVGNIGLPTFPKVPLKIQKITLN